MLVTTYLLKQTKNTKKHRTKKANQAIYSGTENKKERA
jgi:hypothetical protein